MSVPDGAPAVQPGEDPEALAAELVRRLGPARCSFVIYPEGCKDLNDVLQRHGRNAMAAVLDGAKPYPLRGPTGSATTRRCRTS